MAFLGWTTRVRLGLAVALVWSAHGCSPDSPDFEQGSGGNGDGDTGTKTGGTGSDTTDMGATGTGGGATGTDTDTDAPPVSVDCADPPMGAVGADYDHRLQASGGSGSYTWSATGLPPGMALSTLDGRLTGAPDQAGTFTVEVTAVSGANPPVEGQASCTIEVAEALSLDFGDSSGPCIEAGTDVTQFLQGGDGTAVQCSLPEGSGNGKVPAGISVDPDTCQITGTIEETRHGTWVWITAVEQSGYRIHVPYCATQPSQAVDAYGIQVDHDGGTDNGLVPGVSTFEAEQAITYGAASGDPLFTITGGCGSSCAYGFMYSVNASPFDTNTISTAPNSLLSGGGGFSHELSISGDSVPAKFEGRPWVVNFSFDYCLSDTAADCQGGDNIRANGNGNLEFGIIMMPAGG